MSDETFPVALGGRRWQIPHLPFRVLKKAQPRLLKRSRALAGESSDIGMILRLDEESLDDLAEAVFLAVQVADPSLTREVFLDLPFSAADLIGAMPSVIAACGLKVAQRAPAEEGGEEKK